MQTPEKKRRRPAKHLKGMLLIVLTLIISALGVSLFVLSRPAEEAPHEAASTGAQLILRDAAQLASITVTAPEGENYTLLYENGALWYQTAEPFPVDDVLAVDILMACTSLSAEETLAETAPEDLSPFGLAPAQCTVTIACQNGETVTCHIGYRLPLDTGYYFMLAGDQRLYRVHDDILKTFQVAEGVLYPVEQVRLTGALIDEITLYGADDQPLYAFQRRGDSFYMTHPHRYPADREMLANIVTALENFRLGAYVGPEANAALGDHQYRLVIHEAPGSAGVLAGGMLTAAEQPEKTTEMILWPLGDDQAGHCAVNGQVYRFLRLSLAFLYQLDLAWDTLPSKPAGDVTMERLASLRVNGDAYQLSRAERVLPNNEIETDAEGNILYDLSVTKNARAISSDAFEARLAALASVAVGGRLPSGWQPEQPVTDTLVFTFVDGTTRTLTLAPYDALHNAVGVDGEYLFYLIKGGLTF